MLLCTWAGYAWFRGMWWRITGNIHANSKSCTHWDALPVHWGAGTSARLSQSGFLVQGPHSLSYSLLWWHLLVLYTINWVDLLSRQRPILSAVVCCRGSGKGWGKFSTKEGTRSHGSVCWEKEAGKKREEAGCDGKIIYLVVFGKVTPGPMSAMQELNM